MIIHYGGRCAVMYFKSKNTSSETLKTNKRNEINRKTLRLNTSKKTHPDRMTS